MSSIAVAGDTSGVVTISAPAVAGTPTLTLPTTSGTIITTASSTGLDASVISSGTMATARLASGSATSSTYLRGDQTWATISSGGMTLLGTITTTSGSTVTLSGLTLTSYKQLSLYLNGVSLSATGAGLYLDGGSERITGNLASSATNGLSGIVNIELATGVYSSVVATAATASPTGDTAAVYAGICLTTTASTSISITIVVGGVTFDSGSIKVYGVA